MRSFQSNEQFFEAVGDLATSLDLAGRERAASTLRRGLSSLNGLTDGWALLLEAIEEVQDFETNLAPQDRDTLKDIREAAQSAVYRR
jgi:hypothetical protein